jgi:4-hydroxy-tetrahydrodipicolinate synthase
MFTGSLVAIVTPFDLNGEVDYKVLRDLVDFQLDNGTDGIVPVGTTGESPTLSHEEHGKVIKAVVEQTVGRVPVIAGTGSNATREAIELTRYAKEVGVDAVLQVNPYYNKPTQEGLYQHFKAVADAVNIPVVLYNIPGRCAVAMDGETITRLSEISNIVAIKEATGSLDLASEIAMNTDLTILSGDDSITLPLASVGGKGVVSVAANIVPADVKALTDAILAGDFTAARVLHQKLFALCKVMLGLSTNPIPIKAAMAMKGLCLEDVRLPMTALPDNQKEILKEVLTTSGVL